MVEEHFSLGELTPVCRSITIQRLLDEFNLIEPTPDIILKERDEVLVKHFALD